MFPGEEGCSGPPVGVGGLGYSREERWEFWKGRGTAGAEWDKGANLKEYYTKREEQEAQAV